jgi:hypothetical protein
MSLAPACNATSAPSRPSLTHDAWMFGTSSCNTRRLTECMSIDSRKAGPVLHSFNVSEHDGRRTAQPDSMRHLHDLEPVCRAEFVRAYDRAHVVAECFRSSAGQCLQAGVPVYLQRIGLMRFVVK